MAAVSIKRSEWLPPRPRPRRLAWPRTSPFHGGNTGSNPVGDAHKIKPIPAPEVFRILFSHDAVTIGTKRPAQRHGPHFRDTLQDSIDTLFSFRNSRTRSPDLVDIYGIIIRLLSPILN